MGGASAVKGEELGDSPFPDGGGDSGHNPARSLSLSILLPMSFSICLYHFHFILPFISSSPVLFPDSGLRLVAPRLFEGVSVLPGCWGEATSGERAY